ncbi:MAG: undecaprenyldiphospho-muramoylpentapeptide beta-N-acetylglucosaminyltransferase [Thioalkalispiraceae bacterium]|jgi:UDP-N-acetylglucosamine--N-acetylmuramyl-(pentapeptide) pyrophosphoryl-undecaprenol N-acetylglucosamine transferase
MSEQDKVALVMAGGTGGHVFPALAVAEALREKNIKVHWLGTRNGIESRVVPEAGFDISYINIKGLRGNGMLRWLLAPFKIALATIHAVRICMSIKPNVVLGMGGFVTWPGGIASKILAKPLVIHEQNAIPGLTNRLLAKVARRVLEAFPNAYRPSKKVFHTGNPVRKSILDIEKPELRYASRGASIRLLIIGGSLGAKALNEIVPGALAMIDSQHQFEIWHQAGKSKLDSTNEKYKAENVQAKIVEFIDDMEKAYEWADLVICRSGAMTITEISNVGIASILVPYPYAVDDHQTANARYLSDADAAILIQQRDLTPKRLAEELQNIFNLGRDHLLKMAQKALAMARPDATQSVVKHCLEVSL